MFYALIITVLFSTCRLGCVDNSDFDVPRLVRGIQFDLDEYIRFVNDSESLDPANKSRDVRNNLMN